jgi:hypothetical protein
MPAGQAKLDGKIVAVSWNDAHFDLTEMDNADAPHRPWVYVTVGILIKSDSEGVMLAQEEGEDGKTRGRTFVPRGMIIQEWVVGPVKPKVKRTRRKPTPAATTIPNVET